MSQQPATSYQDVTLSLPVDVLKRVRMIADRRKTSLSQLVTQVLEDIMEKDEYQIAMTRHLVLLERSEDLGVVGEVTWTRDDLHER